MRARANLDNISIILAQPQIPENIGAVARAMHNMGLSRLVLVRPRNCELCRVVKMARGSSIDVVQEMELYEDLQNALEP